MISTQNNKTHVSLFLQNLNSKKVLPTDNLTHLLSNVATYMECVGQDGGSGIGSGLSPSLIPLFDTFLRKVVLFVTALGDLNPVLRVLVAVLRVPGVVAHKVSSTGGGICCSAGDYTADDGESLLMHCYMSNFIYTD